MAMRNKLILPCAISLTSLLAPVYCAHRNDITEHSIVHSSFRPFCGGEPAVKRATKSDIAYAGNLGRKDDYGCNMMLVDDSIADHYSYTVNMTNGAPADQSCVCWLKIGPAGGLNGFFTGNEVLNFTIPIGDHRILAVEGNSIGGCTCNSHRIQTSLYGQFAGTWLEFDMGSNRNGFSSGADVSCLVSARYGLDIPGLLVCSEAGGICSTIHAGGTGDNAYLGGMESVDGLGINLPAGEAHLTAVFGYQK